MTEGGRYLLCDHCNMESFSLNLPWTQDSETLRAARAAGWELVFSKGHATRRLLETVCPKCRDKAHG